MLTGSDAIVEKGRLNVRTSHQLRAVLVVDLSLVQHSGVDWLRAVRERCLGLKVIVLNVHL